MGVLKVRARLFGVYILGNYEGASVLQTLNNSFEERTGSPTPGVDVPTPGADSEEIHEPMIDYILYTICHELHTVY